MKEFNRDDYNALKSSNLVKGLANSEQLRFDSVESATVFFARELDQVKAKTYDKLYPELSALAYFPITSEVNEGAETTTYYSYDITGMAAIINNYATDLPRVDVKGESHTAHIKSIGDSYGYNVQEMRASRMAGKSLDARKGAAARRASDYKEILVFLYLLDEQHVLEHLKRDLNGDIIDDVRADLETWKNEIHSLISLDK